MKRSYGLALLLAFSWAQEREWVAPVFLPIKDAEAREQLRKGGAPDGTVVKGQEDSCLYYLHAGTWFRLCGECQPSPAPIEIDSISVGAGDLWVSWRGKALEEGEEIEVWIFPDSVKWIGTSPSFYFSLRGGGWYQVQLRRRGRCGVSPWTRKDSIWVTYKRCPPLPLEGKLIELFAAGSTCWATQDWEGPPALAVSRQKDGTRYYSNRQLQVLQNATPSGWRLPTLKECEALLQVISLVPERLKKFAPSQKGAYAPSEKRWVGMGESSVYLISDAPDKALVIHPLGGLIAPLEGKEIHARLRLVRSTE